VELVLDTGVLLAACLGRAGFAPLAGHVLNTVDLVHWEAESILHEFVWRLGRGLSNPQWPGLTIADFQAGFESLKVSVDPASAAHRIEVHAFGPRLADEAWFVAERCGFAKVYDAASVALARLRGCRLVTLDGRLLNSPAQRLATLVGPTRI
jgi:predicted nucleic acid-binding protein